MISNRPQQPADRQQVNTTNTTARKPKRLRVLLIQSKGRGLTSYGPGGLHDSAACSSQHKSAVCPRSQAKASRPTARNSTLNSSTPSNECLTCKSDLHDSCRFITARAIDLLWLMLLRTLPPAAARQTSRRASGKQRITRGDGGLVRTEMAVPCTTCLNPLRNAPETRPHLSCLCKPDLFFEGSQCWRSSYTTILACRPACGLDVGLMRTVQVEDTASNTLLT